MVSSPLYWSLLTNNLVMFVVFTHLHLLSVDESALVRVSGYQSLELWASLIHDSRSHSRGLSGVYM